MSNWITKHYPKGTRIRIADTRTGKLETATVVNHLAGSGFQARHTVGVVVQFADGTRQRVSAAFLDDTGGDRV